MSKLTDIIQHPDKGVEEIIELRAEIARRDEIIKRLVKKVLRMDDFVGDSDHEHDDRIL